MLAAALHHPAVLCCSAKGTCPVLRLYVFVVLRIAVVLGFVNICAILVHQLYGAGVYVADGDAVADGLGLATGLAVEVAVGLVDGDGVSVKLVADIFQTWALLNSACVGIL